VPDWLVRTADGLQTMLQVIPAAVIAVFVLVLGSLFVVAQQATAQHGNRASLLLAGEPRVWALATHPLLVSVGSLLLAGQVPEANSAPASAVTAGAATLALATAWTLAAAGPRLYTLLAQFTAPVNYARAALNRADLFLETGETGLVVFRVGLLGEMLRNAISRGDATSATHAVIALRYLVDMYVAAADRNPRAREHTYDNSTRVTGWLAHELRHELVAAGALAVSSGSPEEEPMAIAGVLEHLGVETIAHGWREEPAAVIEALVQLGTSIQQIAVNGAINFYAPAGEALARLEAAATGRGISQLAVDSTAGWLLVVSYWQLHLQSNPEVALERGIYDLSHDPPFHEAAVLILSEPFSRKWLNKMPNGPYGVIGTLEQARHAHAEVHGREPTPPPVDEDFEALNRRLDSEQPGRARRIFRMIKAAADQLSEQE
jgi:hypothetical protein